MLDLFFNIGAALVGAALGYAIGSAIANYLDKAKNWFQQAWNSISKISRAVGILVRRGNRLFKQFVVETFGGEVDVYEPTDDSGVEVKEEELSDEARNALFGEDGYIPVAYYE